MGADVSCRSLFSNPTDIHARTDALQSRNGRVRAELKALLVPKSMMHPIILAQRRCAVSVQAVHCGKAVCAPRDASAVVACFEYKRRGKGGRTQKSWRWRSAGGDPWGGQPGRRPRPCRREPRRGEGRCGPFLMKRSLILLISEGSLHSIKTVQKLSHFPY